jgi:hypothetical protein
VNLTTTRSYRVGGWFGIFGDHATVLLPPSEKARVGRLWELVDEGAGFDEVLDALISSGLRELPGFVLVSEAEADTKVVIRGVARARFTTDGETIELEGSAATTWVERSMEGVTAMVVEVGDEAADGEDLPVGNGLVRVSRVDAPPHAAEQESPAVPVADWPSRTAQPAPVAAFTDEPTPEPLEQPVDAPVEELVEGPLEEPGPVAEAEPVVEGADEPVDDLSEDGPDELVDTAANFFPFAGEPVPVPVTEPPPPAIPSDPAPPTTDHDGMTRSGNHDPGEFAPPQPGIPGQPPAPSITRPVARLVFSSGQTVEVDRITLIGRAPEARRFPSNEQPRLITVPSPHQEISSTHLEVRPGSGADHGTAVVTDLGSTNGSVLVQPGLPPEDLQAGIAVQLIPGAIIDLGDGVTIQVINP